VPQGIVTAVLVGEPGWPWAWVEPCTDPASGKPYALGFNQLFLDPYTGEELGRAHVAGDHLLMGGAGLEGNCRFTLRLFPIPRGRNVSQTLTIGPVRGPGSMAGTLELAPLVDAPRSAGRQYGRSGPVLLVLADA
jgi:hypothetical protein